MSILLPLSVYGQTSELDKIDSALTVTFKKMASQGAYTADDRLVAEFQEKLLQELKNPVMFSESLLWLARYVKIVSSPDKKVKFYSWDDHMGGSVRHIISVA